MRGALIGLLCVWICQLLSAAPLLAVDEPGPLRLSLPDHILSVAETETSVYFDNIVLTETPEAYQFDVECAVGRSEARRWVVKPNSDDVGSHSFTVTVRDSSGKRLGRQTAQLQIMSAAAAVGQSLRIMLVGDSLTHATIYPNELARLLSRPGNPSWKMLGTHRPKNAAEGVRHEGYGGWTWQRFASRYEPEPDGTHRKRSSPFVFPGADSSPSLDVSRYFEETTAGQRPDVVFFLLGINDCFSADPDDLTAIDARIDVMLQQADVLLDEFRSAAPDADLAVCITTPPNSRESGFEANYKGRYHRWGWKRIQHRLVERLLDHVSDRQKKSKGISKGGREFVVPTHLNLDPIDGYPVNNGVHPNAVGYEQIGASLYCWIKWWSSEARE